MNADNTDQEKSKPLKRRGTEEAEETLLPQIDADDTNWKSGDPVIG